MGSTAARALARRLTSSAAVLALAGASVLTLGPGAAHGIPPPRITIIGDSVADVLEYVPEARSYLGRGLDLNLQLRVCRRLVADGCYYEGERPPTALDVVQSSTPAQLGDVLVVDVGYNDPPPDYSTDMAVFMNAVLAKGVTHVVWVTMREADSGYHVINQAIRAAPSRWPEIDVADWNAASRGKSWFNQDGIHLNAGGAMGLAKLLRPAILSACGSRCAAAARLTSQPAKKCPRGTRRVRRGGKLVCVKVEPS